MSEGPEYPKMVYPHGADVKNTSAGTGVIVNSAEEEADAMKDAPNADESKPAAGSPGWKA